MNSAPVEAAENLKRVAFEYTCLLFLLGEFYYVRQRTDGVLILR